MLISNEHNHVIIRRRDRNFVPRGLPKPTDAEPGSVEKIAVLSARVEAGLELHHPFDKRMPEIQGRANKRVYSLLGDDPWPWADS